MTQIERARNIQASFGTYRAARYLSARGWSIEAALEILTGALRKPKGKKRGKHGH